MKGDFDGKRQVPAMVAAVSSASSLSFSSCRFSSSLWCFLCNSSMTFWWDSSMAAKPLSHVACGGGKHGTTVSLRGRAGHGPKKVLAGGRERTLWAHRSTVGADRRRLQQISCKRQPVSLERAAACASAERVERNDRIHGTLKERTDDVKKTVLESRSTPRRPLVTVHRARPARSSCRRTATLFTAEILICLAGQICAGMRGGVNA